MPPPPPPHVQLDSSWSRITLYTFLTTNLSTTTTTSQPLQSPQNNDQQTLLASLKTQLAQLKKDKADKAVVEKVAEQLEQLKYSLPEELGGFNTSDRARYEKALEKMKRAQAFQPTKAKKEKKHEADEDIPPPTQTHVPGKKKDISGELARGYHPTPVEAVWDAWWEEKGFYTCNAQEAMAVPHEERFTMVIPPPNVTGYLHIGHALTCSIEDLLTRWHRMCGHKTMWLPGTDHAGIATQAVVEKLLIKEWEANNKQGPRTRHDLGRDAFIKRVWDWKNEKGGFILKQLRRLGASVDHSRTVFTMDEPRSNAVKEAFCRLYDSNKIYRATRLVHWSYSLRTAISAIEVDNETVEIDSQYRAVPGHVKQAKYRFGLFHEFAYPVHPDAWKPGMPKEIVVATTRLETMLGDVAVCVNPQDERYKSLHNVRLLHPYHPNREMRVLCDNMARIDLGTGAVKITPAHDENDFAAAERLKIDPKTYYSIFDDNGAVSQEAAGTSGVGGEMRYDARILIQKDLEKKGLFRGEKPNPGQILPICSRSGDVVEPRLVPQWWVRMDEMASGALQAVETGALKLIPAHHETTWKQWLSNCQPWCISRQLWWGHRVPAYRVRGGPSEQWFVGRNEIEASTRASTELKRVVQPNEMLQDEDVLDTWFSSGLFPFYTFGWPNEDDPDFKAFFPGHVLETGQDILFFWVARMVMMSLALTGKLPFTTVFLHAMIRDKDGRKMTKSLGNVVDPLEVIEGRTLQELVDKLHHGNLSTNEVKTAERGMRDNYPEGMPECGTDALRFGLVAYTLQDTNINLDIDRIHAARHFCNKIWQIARFCESLVLKAGDKWVPEKSARLLNGTTATTKLSMRDMWILHRVSRCAQACNTAFKQYCFYDGTTALYDFWFYELADVYVESIKPLFRGDITVQATDALDTLFLALDMALKLLHPIMPFLTEELWQRLKGHPPTRAESLMVSKYPQFRPEWENVASEAHMSLVQAVVKSIRSILAKYNASASSSKISVDVAGTLSQEAIDDITTLAKVAKINMVKPDTKFGQGVAMEVVNSSLSVGVGLGNLIDPKAEKERLDKSMQEKLKLMAELENRLAQPKYLEKAKPQVLEQDRRKLEELKAAILTVQTEIANMEQMMRV